MARTPIGNPRPHVALPPQPLRLKTGGIRVLQGGQSLKTNRPASGPENASTTSSPPPPFYRRLLYPYASEDVPPPILVTPGSEYLDTQIYGLLALVCRGFISPWYMQISRDRAFLLEIVRVASHVVRQLEARLVEDGSAKDTRSVDKLRFLCVSMPNVLERHFLDYRTAQGRSGSAYAAGALRAGEADTAAISAFEAHFHSLQPHIAVTAPHLKSPTSDVAIEKTPAHLNADYLRAAIEALLRNFMPPEDYCAETERTVVREVILGIILAGIFNKVAQPWFIYSIMIKLLEQRPKGQATFVQEHTKPQDPSSKISSVLQSAAGYIANLPSLLYRLSAFFASISLIVTTAFASPYYRHFVSSPPDSAGHALNEQLTKPLIDLVSTVLRAEIDGRQVLNQLLWTAKTGCTVASSLLDR